MEKLNADPKSIFYSKLSLNDIGVFGHSVGGVAAAEALRTDNRIIAGINLDGLSAGQPLFNDENITGLQKSFLFITKGSPVPSDKKLKELAITREKWNEHAEQANDKIFGMLKQLVSEAYYTELPGASHESFSVEARALWPQAARIS